MMLDILGDQKRVDETPLVAEPTLDRWPADPEVQFRVRGIWGRQYAFKHQPELALPLLDAALDQPHSPNDHERAAAVPACREYLRRRAGPPLRRSGAGLARSSETAPPIEAGRSGRQGWVRHRRQGGQHHENTHRRNEGR